MIKILIIYEVVNTTIKIFDLFVTQEQSEKILKCHGKYINSSDWPPECEWLVEFLNDYHPIYESDCVLSNFAAYNFTKPPAFLVVTGYVS